MASQEVVRFQVRHSEIAEEGVVQEFFEAGSGRLEQMAETVERFSTSMLTRLKKIGNPKSISLEFGVSAGGKAGIPFVTEGTAEANFKVSIEWAPGGNAE